MHGFLFLARSYSLMFSKFLHDSADFPRKENLFVSIRSSDILDLDVTKAHNSERNVFTFGGANVVTVTENVNTFLLV